MSTIKQRCEWVSADPTYIHYHDKEWGRPVRDTNKLFAMLCLEGQQAGLSWITVLKKRDNYYLLFDGFNPKKIAHYTADKIIQLLQNPGIIRNRLKVNAIVNNAQLMIQYEQINGDFGKFLWHFVGGRPIINHWRSMKTVPVTTPESDAMAVALKKLGFKFVGSTICYAFMQAVGMVNDHTQHCYLHKVKK